MAGREIDVGESQDTYKIRNSMGQLELHIKRAKGGYIKPILIFLFTWTSYRVTLNSFHSKKSTTNTMNNVRDVWGAHSYVRRGQLVDAG